jgi:hypothetical protein
MLKPLVTGLILSIALSNAASAQFSLQLVGYATHVANGGGPYVRNSDTTYTSYAGLPFTDASNTLDQNVSGAIAGVNQSASATPGLYHLNLSAYATSSSGNGAGAAFSGGIPYYMVDTLSISAPAGSWVQAHFQMGLVVSDSSAFVSNPGAQLASSTYSITQTVEFNLHGANSDNHLLRQTVTEADGILTNFMDGSGIAEVGVSGVLTIDLKHNLTLGAVVNQNNLTGGTSTLDLDFDSLLSLLDIEVFEADQSTPQPFTSATVSGFNYAIIPEPGVSTAIAGFGALSLGLARRRKRAA